MPWFGNPKVNPFGGGGAKPGLFGGASSGAAATVYIQGADRLGPAPATGLTAMSTAGASTRVETRARFHTPGAHVSEMWLLYEQVCVTSAGVETRGGSGLSLEACIETGAGGAVARAPFRGRVSDPVAALLVSGANTGTMTAPAASEANFVMCGPVVPADLGLASMGPNAAWFARTTVVGADGASYAPGVEITGVIAGEGSKKSDAASGSSQCFATGALTGTNIGGQGQGVTPIGVLMVTARGEISVYRKFDSNGHQEGDGSAGNGGNYSQVAFNNSNGRIVPNVGIDRSGGTIQQMKSMPLCDRIAKWATHVHSDLFPNDIAVAGRNLAQISADFDTMKANLLAINPSLKFIWAKSSPRVGAGTNTPIATFGVGSLANQVMDYIVARVDYSHLLTGPTAVLNTTGWNAHYDPTNANFWLWSTAGTPADGIHGSASQHTDKTTGSASYEVLQVANTLGGAVNQAPSAPAITWRGGFLTGLVPENTSVSTVLADLSSTDPQGQTVTFSEVTDADAKFSVVGSTITLAAALVYATKTSHDYTVRATDSQTPGLTADTTVTVQVGYVAAPAEAAETTAVFAQMAVKGATVLTTGNTNYRGGGCDTLIAGLKTDGIWTCIRHMGVWTAIEEAATKVNWKNPGTNDPSKVGSPIFTTKSDFNPNANNANYINLNYSPAALLASDVAVNEYGVFIYNLTDDALTGYDCGQVGASGDLEYRINGTTARAHIGTNTNASISSLTASIGFSGVRRCATGGTGGSTANLRYYGPAGAPRGNIASTQVAVAGTTMAALNGAGAASAGTRKQGMIITVGAGMTDAMVANLATRVNAFYASIAGGSPW